MTEIKAAASSYDFLVTWIESRIQLLGFEGAFSEPSNSSLIDFITGDGPKLLSLSQDARDDKIHLSIDFISSMNAYFIRPNVGALSKENISKNVQYGTVGGSGLSISALERIMKGLVDKQVSQNPMLTDGARNELSRHYHACMATLTDTVHCTDGRTVLYCPAFDFNSVSEAALNKDLVQIMEAVVIHWTRQIKDVVNNHDNAASAETSGPLDEIDFWKFRAQDLLGIQEQLQGINVLRISEVLNYSKSNYIGPFEDLSKQIIARAAEANDNLKYLETIREQCVALRDVEAGKVVTVLAGLLNRVRLIWSHSTFYNNEDRVCGILRKISNEIIRRFRMHVPVSEVWDGDVELCISRLQESIHCGVEWKAIYHKTVAAILRNKHKYNGKMWNIEDASIFAQIDAFVQRCRDLIEVCESQMQFVRKSSSTSGRPGPLPQFGGTKAQEIVDYIIDIQTSFESQIERLRKLGYDVLDVRVSRWHDDYHVFKNSVKDLEVMFTNIINSSFENNSTIAEGVILIDTFHKLAKREVVVRFDYFSLFLLFL